ncbi:MAG TPA: glycosyltransferase family A protein, partial [Coleofasciculaceae cyanobacterium]
MPSPLISLILPTYGREDVLRETIASILQQDYDNYEVLIIDQTPTHTPETQTYLESLAAQQKIRLFWVDWASLPGARNYGIRRAKGEIILF